MYPLALSVLLVLSASAMAAEDSIYTGSELLEHCTSKDISEWTFCMGYILGVRQGYLSGTYMASAPEDFSMLAIRTPGG